MLFGLTRLARFNIEKFYRTVSHTSVPNLRYLFPHSSSFKLTKMQGAKVQLELALSLSFYL